MKYIVIIFFVLFVFGNIKPEDTANDNDNVEFLEYINKEDFNYWKIIEKASIKNHETDLSRRISIVSKEAPDYRRIVYKKKSIYGLPTFYLKQDGDIILTNKESFYLADNILDTGIVNDAKKCNKDIAIKSEKEFTKKGWNVLKFTRSDACLIKLKMSIGFFNKNTKSMKLIGDYDDEVIVYHLVW